jgi:hypothetical protein
VDDAYAPPALLRGAHPFLYRNRGDGAFEDVSATTGIRATDPASGQPVAKALGLLPADLDGDGVTDLFVANDTTRNLFFRGRGDGTFEETGELAGLAYDADGGTTGAMGVDFGYLHQEGGPSLVVGNYAGEITSFYRADDDASLFTDESLAVGLGPATRPALTFGLLLFDADLDGHLDLLQANGHVEPDIALADPTQSYRQPTQLFWNDGGERFLLPGTTTGDLSRPLAGRGAAYVDTDGDGDLDLVVTQAGDRAILFRNDQDTGHHWLRVRLAGADGATLGSRVRLVRGGRAQTRWIQPTRSYLSQTELVTTFGLGPEATTPRLEVEWPDGYRRRMVGLRVNRLVVVVRSPRPRSSAGRLTCRAVPGGSRTGRGEPKRPGGTMQSRGVTLRSHRLRRPGDGPSGF